MGIRKPAEAATTARALLGFLGTWWDYIAQPLLQ